MMDALGMLKPALLAGAIVLGLRCNQAVPRRRRPRRSLSQAAASGASRPISRRSGRSGGRVGLHGRDHANPTYRQVWAAAPAITRRSDHLRPFRCQLRRDPRLFLRSVDPTDAGGQFCDRGESYRTAIFVDGAEERRAAEAAIAEAQRALGRTVVTPVLDEAPFYEAEAYHQDYYKSDDIILTRFGPRSKEAAYKLYREACGRDERVRALWGAEALFAG
jgi:peptide-methionine (S)-S-oxide reductase